MKKALIILGSARKHSDTKKELEHALDISKFEVIDLLDLNIEPYNYENKYSDTDEFSIVAKQLLVYPKIIFATPVYWYAMSGHMKFLFDRFTDLVTFQKPTGRQLKGKSIYLFTVGTDDELPPGFEIPFTYTAQYLDMNYNGALYLPRHFSSSAPEEYNARVSNFTSHFY